MMDYNEPGDVVTTMEEEIPVEEVLQPEE